MDEKILEKIANAVHKEHDWKKDQIRIDEAQELKHGSCSFYAVRHTVRPLSYVLNYAVLSGETVLSVSDEQAAAKILDACGSDATAGWWAEVVTRFHEELGQGIVLHDAKDNFGAIDQIQSAKREFMPPKFSEDASGKSVTFYLFEAEEFAVYFVKATRNKDKTITVNKAAL
ncbi:MAG TPA: hypothetical protein VLH08_19930 [Acidobacteriota bacterium]|nr:hypothetical protein [Acidobacteriota bacterium]